MVTVFQCDPWEQYLEQLVEQGAADQRDADLEADLEHECNLAQEWINGEGGRPWPWYSNRPYEVQEPEIIDCWVK